MFRKKPPPVNPDKWVEKIDCISDLFIGEEKAGIIDWLKEHIEEAENIIIIYDYHDEDGDWALASRRYAYPERVLWLMEQYKKHLIGD